MDRYLTNGVAFHPVVLIISTSNFAEVGRWGPRPSELQAWVMANRPLLPKVERLREQRQWYARDRGETTMREVLNSVNGKQ